ncbi:UNVERIFIED_CONTAM: hypothetical protein PYX00_006577 [Menopon gallinae]|uniref:Uncharacterized protein n=1 Tax=Menopon gallinae TaxID=328185 RepID=A0AAW2HXC8_9NEOP
MLEKFRERWSTEYLRKIRVRSALVTMGIRQESWVAVRQFAEGQDDIARVTEVETSSIVVSGGCVLCRSNDQSTTISSEAVSKTPVHEPVEQVITVCGFSREVDLPQLGQGSHQTCKSTSRLGYGSHSSTHSS